MAFNQPVTKAFRDYKVFSKASDLRGIYLFHKCQRKLQTAFCIVIAH